MNHSDPEEEQLFRALLAQLLDPGAVVEEERRKEESGYAEVYPKRYLKSTMMSKRSAGKNEATEGIRAYLYPTSRPLHRCEWRTMIDIVAMRRSITLDVT